MCSWPMAEIWYKYMFVEEFPYSYIDGLVCKIGIISVTHNSTLVTEWLQCIMQTQARGELKILINTSTQHQHSTGLVRTAI